MKAVSLLTLTPGDKSLFELLCSTPALWFSTENLVWLSMVLWDCVWSVFELLRFL